MVPSRGQPGARQHLFERVFQDAKAEREHVATIQEDFLKRSFNALLAQADAAIIAAEEEIDRRVQGAEGRLRKAELIKEQHEQRRCQRLAATERGRNVVRGEVTVVGSALLIPLLAQADKEIGGQGDAGRRTDTESEQTAVQVARRYETDRGALVRSVEDDHVGFDLLSTLGLERRCIEVKGRAGVGRVELTWSEFAKSQELGDDYWLYLVLDCAEPSPRLYRVRNPAKTLAGAWEPSLDVRYRVDPEPVIEASKRAPAMIRRLIEEELPLKAANAQSAREKSLRHGNISTMHLWWARRPLAMSRAVVFGTLLPDPGDEAAAEANPRSASRGFVVRGIGARGPNPPFAKAAGRRIPRQSAEGP